MSKIVIIGGLGWIGLHLIKRLANNHEVIVFDPHKPTDEECAFLTEYPHAHFETDYWTLMFSGIARDADVVVSLPGMLGSVSSVESYTSNLHRSISPHLVLLETLRMHDLTPLVVFASSDLAYRKPPRCLYTANKLYVENALRIAHRIYGIPYVALRMATGYGPMQRRDSVVNFYVRRGLEGGEIPVWGEGLNRQAFIYADDMARAFEMACEGKFPTGVYPLVGHNESPMEIATVVAKVVGGGIVHEDFPKLAKLVNVGDLPVYGNPPGFSPRISLEEGIGRTAEWMLNNG